MEVEFNSKCLVFKTKLNFFCIAELRKTKLAEVLKINDLLVNHPSIFKELQDGKWGKLVYPIAGISMTLAET